MKPRHISPVQPRIDRKTQDRFEARAPYNFVPLPEEIILAPKGLPTHNSYWTGLLTGRLECTLETLSPTYVRGMLSSEDYEYFEKEMVRNANNPQKLEKLEEEKKQKQTDFFSLDNRPAIPGSSLRGMLRNLVEVAGFSRMRWVAATPSFTFRAVAASKDNPLSQPYKNILGAFGKNVRAGYLQRVGEDWRIRPAQMPQKSGIDEEKGYIPVPEYKIRAREIDGFRLFNDHNFKPGYYKVSFHTERNQSGKILVKEVGSPASRLGRDAVLVSTGNMLEVEAKASKRSDSPRKKHVLVLPIDSNAQELGISRIAAEDYLKGLSPFEQELEAWGGKDGCLKNGAPVFYVQPPQGKSVEYFGHCPNFRVPARAPGAQRASTPLDYVPDALRTGEVPDMADAIFGWVLEKQSGSGNQYAGRVSFSDALLQTPGNDLWLQEMAFPLHILGSPKPSTFAHYLVQDTRKGHNPDDKASLANYGTSLRETQVRGHKFYWIKGSHPEIQASEQELEHPKQLAYVKPLKPGIAFHFTIHFENLRSEELGALCWALTLPSHLPERHCHRLGMGKPLGMGVVSIQPELFLSDRQMRYQELIKDGTWHLAESPGDAVVHIQKFEKFILKNISSEEAVAEGVSEPKRLADLERIDALLTMLEWHEGTKEWLDWTRYMEIKHPISKVKDVNEYKEQPVLPRPQDVVRKTRGKQPMGEHTDRTIPSTTPSSQQVKQRSANQLPPGYHTGVVKVYGEGGKPFGFIKPDSGGPDVFFHISQLVGVQSLDRGQRVSFKQVPGKQGKPAAEDVRIIK